MSRRDPTKYAFPAAPGNGAIITLLQLTGFAASLAKRVVVAIRSSAASATDGLSFNVLLDSDTTYRPLVTFTIAAATSGTPFTNNDVAYPTGTQGIQVTYANSANDLTIWAGNISVIYDERAAP
jgi:hypothetical protein